ncbi:bacteriophage abortive infection AbiH family protein [Morganella morganii]|uniref:bacteriophage abortive infection AbiH family protein n=1 Tax=Morganella morganii TaxID=582 RepID=UPI001C5AD691|nr:bacteriophage abortive infection AbiH family protein [Morganella morganii]MBW4180117.1 bacteriophage abortive infection AbiH family protein [Morganella morganii]
MKLYIIGNGFDLYHNLKTSYGDFHDYIKIKDHDVYRFVNDYAPAGDEWNELESSLGSIDFYNIIYDCENFLVPYSDENFRSHDHHSFQYEVGNIAENLSSKLLQHFSSWIKSIKVPVDPVFRKFKFFELDSIFLTFNYTNTLEYLYLIEKEKIKHIHGSISDGSKITLGHSWERSVTINPSPGAEQDIRICDAYDSLDDMFDINFKNCKKIIKEEMEYFESLSSVSEVIIIGHSLSDVDAEYFKEILKFAPKNTIWRYALRDPQNDHEKTQMLIHLGINEKFIRNIPMHSL